MKLTPYGPYDLVDQRKHSVYRFTDSIWKIVQFYDDRERHGPGPRQNHKTYDEKLPASISRTKRVILELALCNPWDYFVTLTIAPDYDRDHLKATFPVILQWLRDQRKKGQQLDYLLIPERHKNGSWHFHGFLHGVRESDSHVSDGDTASIEYFIRYYAPYSGDKMTGLYHYERYSHTTTIKSIYEDSSSGLQWCIHDGINCIIAQFRYLSKQ